jgi:hypothetical protein
MERERNAQCIIVLTVAAQSSALGTPASRRLTGANIGIPQINREIAAACVDFEEKIRSIVKASRRDAGVPRAELCDHIKTMMHWASHPHVQTIMPKFAGETPALQRAR